MSWRTLTHRLRKIDRDRKKAEDKKKEEEKEVKKDETDSTVQHK
jgi:predicted RNA polymerase sigma factor